MRVSASDFDSLTGDVYFADSSNGVMYKTTINGTDREDVSNHPIKSLYMVDTYGIIQSNPCIWLTLMESFNQILIYG